VDRTCTVGNQLFALHSKENCRKKTCIGNMDKTCIITLGAQAQLLHALHSKDRCAVGAQ
jgi:hypothetical protein